MKVKPNSSPSTPTHFTYKKNELYCEQVALKTIAQHVGTPAYIYSAAAFLEPLSALQQGLQGLDFLICFAMKANSNLSVLKLLASHGAGMDIVSGGELFRASKAGVAANHIVFSGVGKTQQEMQEALLYGQGIYSFNVESIHELQVLNQVALRLGKKARIALRFNPDVNPKTHPYISTGLKKNKFGITKAEVLNMIKTLDLYSGIELKGISIHIGSQLTQLTPLHDAFTKLSQLLKILEKRLKTPLEFIDLGGGLGISYQNEKIPSIQKYCALIQKYFGKSGKHSNLKILIEPGRTISAEAGILLTTVLYRKKKLKKDFLIVDAGMNDLIRPALYQSVHTILPVEQKSGKTRQTDLVGPVCESADCFVSQIPLDANLDAQDLLAIRSTGAYGFSMASNYNSRGRPPEILVRGTEFKIIRTRETYEDLMRGET